MDDETRTRAAILAAIPPSGWASVAAVRNAARGHVDVTGVLLAMVEAGELEVYQGGYPKLYRPAVAS